MRVDFPLLGAVGTADCCRSHRVSVLRAALAGDDGIVHVTLLKRSRPGRYCRAEDEAAPSPLLITQGQGAGGGRAASQAQAGGAVAPRRAPATAADTFWPTLFVDAPDACRLRGEHPPTGYYVSADDDE